MQANTSQARMIVLEGGEGVGKSTNLKYICDYLKQANIDFIATREPGGTPLAEEIRQLVIAPREEPVDDMTELLMIFAARAQHVAQCIKPALEKNQWVVSDRFVDASYVYQGMARGMGDEEIAQLEQQVLKDFSADHVIILDSPVELSRARAQSRGDLDRFEQEDIEFHHNVRNAYLQRAQSNPEKYSVIDASKELPQVFAQIQSVLDQQILLSIEGQ